HRRAGRRGVSHAREHAGGGTRAGSVGAPIRAVPGPGGRGVNGGAGAFTSDHDDQTVRLIEGNGRTRPWLRPMRWITLVPLGSVPHPRVVEDPGLVRAAKQDDLMANTVVGGHRHTARGWSIDFQIAPHRSVPEPGVA